MCSTQFSATYHLVQWHHQWLIFSQVILEPHLHPHIVLALNELFLWNKNLPNYIKSSLLSTPSQILPTALIACSLQNSTIWASYKPTSPSTDLYCLLYIMHHKSYNIPKNQTLNTLGCTSTKSCTHRPATLYYKNILHQSCTPPYISTKSNYLLYPDYIYPITQTTTIYILPLISDHTHIKPGSKIPLFSKFYQASIFQKYDFLSFNSPVPAFHLHKWLESVIITFTLKWLFLLLPSVVYTCSFNQY